MVKFFQEEYSSHDNSGCLEGDFEMIAEFHFGAVRISFAEFLLRAVRIAGVLHMEHGKLQEDILKATENRDAVEIRARVENLLPNLLCQELIYDLFGGILTDVC